jgi:hypothetical protein
MWLTASGANMTVTLNSSIVVPTGSVLYTAPLTYTIASGKKVKIGLRYDATLNSGQWEVETVEGDT